MIIGLIGPHCSGKETVAKFLRDNHDCRLIDEKKVFNHYISQLPKHSSQEEEKELKIEKVFLDQYEEDTQD